MYVTEDMEKAASDVMEMLRVMGLHVYWNGMVQNPRQMFSKKASAHELDSLPHDWVHEASDVVNSASMLWNGEGEAQFLPLVVTAQLMGWTFTEADAAKIERLDDGAAAARLIVHGLSAIEDDEVGEDDLRATLVERARELLPHLTLAEVSALASGIVDDEVAHQTRLHRSRYPMDLAIAVTDALAKAAASDAE